MRLLFLGSDRAKRTSKGDRAILQLQPICVTPQHLVTISALANFLRCSSRTYLPTPCHLCKYKIIAINQRLIAKVLCIHCYWT
jgi:hypothetical protein